MTPPKKELKKILVDEEDLYEIELDLSECCGIEILHCLSDNPNANIVKAKESSLRRAMITYTDAVVEKNGSRLTARIRKLKLGTVSASKIKMNPNSKRNIQMWIWYPDWKAINSYVDKRIKIV